MVDPGTAYLVGSGISAAGSMLGGFLGSASNKKVAKQQWRRTKVLNQNQVQWRVADAKAAGIHPLAALGMSPIGQAAMPTGSVMGDAVAGAAEAIGRGVSGAATAKRQEVMDDAALAESGARTAEALSGARANQAQAEWLDQQRLNSIIGLFKSPGRVSQVDSLGQPIFNLPPKTGHVIPKYLDPNTRPISRAHAKALEDVTPGALKGAPVTVHGSGGLQFEVDPGWTPGALVEELLGEGASIISYLNTLNSLFNTGTWPAGPAWWQNEEGYRSLDRIKRNIEKRTMGHEE